MSRIIIELQGKPKKGDIIVFDGENFVCKSPKYLLEQIYADLKAIKDTVSKQNDKIELTINAIDDKLRSYHNILQVLTREDK